jgi:hypothetical protein
LDFFFIADIIGPCLDAQARGILTLRMGVWRFTRLTNAFSKKFENHCHMVAIYHAFYNFCRVHQTLRVTPAMEAGLADHVRTLEELVGRLDAVAVKAA